jgi:hypothetical protein
VDPLDPLERDRRLIARTRRAASAFARAKSAWSAATTRVRAARTSVGKRTRRSSASVSCAQRAWRIFRWLARARRGWTPPCPSTRTSDRTTVSISGVRARPVCSGIPERNASTGIPPNAGGESTRFAVRQSNRSRIEEKPPSSRIAPDTRRGWRTASSRATFAPQECPTTNGRRSRVARITAAASAVVRSNP